LALGWLAFAFVVAAVSRIAFRAIVPAREHDHVSTIASPLMPALGATFAVLMALTLSSEAGYLRNAQDIVSLEAAAASRLAWAATNPRVDGEPIHVALADYLRSTRTYEWEGSDATEGNDPETAKELAQLQRLVRAEAARSDLSTAQTGELLGALDALTSQRRARIAAGSRTIPVMIILTLIASGAALVANGGALLIRSSLRTSVLVAGLAVVVGLSLALLFALTAPWNGPLIVSGRAIDTVVRDLQSGFFAL
jgi:hypothetical protein